MALGTALGMALGTALGMRGVEELAWWVALFMRADVPVVHCIAIEVALLVAFGCPTP